MPDGTTGYLFGIFDLFHIAHLDSLRLAGARCDRLVVAVATDDLVERTVGKRPFVPAIERVEIIGAVRAVSSVRLLDSLDVTADAARAGAALILVPGGELDAVQGAASAYRSGLPVVTLDAGRETTSSQVRAALAGSTSRSSVA